MGKFEVMREKVTIKDEAGEDHLYTLTPARGEHISEFFKLLKEITGSFKDVKKEDLTEDKLKESNLEEIPISPESMQIAHMLIMDSFTRTYGKEIKKDTLEEFVSQNLMTLLEPLLNVNLRTHVDKDDRTRTPAKS